MEHSDIVFNAKAFEAGEISTTTEAVNKKLLELGAQTPAWWDVGAEKYRQMRRNGETAFPKPQMLNGVGAEVPSRDSGRKIPIRIMKPDGDVKPKSVFMYIHGGGWVLMAEDLYDPLLKEIANRTDSVVVSVGYRLAPEYPWPAGRQDCDDVADWLIDNAVKEYGASFQFIGGDSAGGNLTMTTYIHLAEKRSEHQLSGLINFYGCYDLTLLPQARNYTEGVVLPTETMKQFIAAYCPDKSTEDLKNPLISPLYYNFHQIRNLPPAIFLCGTNDPLYDDNAFMHMKWVMAGGKASTRFYRGVPHGFMSFPRNMLPAIEEGLQFTATFVKETIR